MDGKPITPPPEVLTKCYEQAERQSQAGYSLKFVMRCVTRTAYAAGHAAGANQELEACCEWLAQYRKPILAADLRFVRRPKPPSLKEQALANTNAILNDPNRALLTEVRETLELNRRALEQLDD